MVLRDSYSESYQPIRRFRIGLRLVLIVTSHCLGNSLKIGSFDGVL